MVLAKHECAVGDKLKKLAEKITNILVDEKVCEKEAYCILEMIRSRYILSHAMDSFNAEFKPFKGGG